MKMIFHSHANKTHFHKKGCAFGLILKVRVFGTRKWPIAAMLQWAPMLLNTCERREIFKQAHYFKIMLIGILQFILLNTLLSQSEKRCCNIF